MICTACLLKVDEQTEFEHVSFKVYHLGHGAPVQCWVAVRIVVGIALAVTLAACSPWQLACPGSLRAQPCTYPVTSAFKILIV